jgi:glucokinase
MELVIDFGGTFIKAGVIDRGVVVAATSDVVQGTSEDLSTAVRLARHVQTLAGGEVTGVGLAVPGVVSLADGRLLHANDKYEWLTRTDLRAWGETTFGAPAIVENDARAALIGETTFGAASGTRDAVILVLGTGIGTAAMIGGELIRGAHNHAGILGGHFTIDIDGPRCPCGNTGCAEALASTWALRKTHPHLAGIKGLVRAAECDDAARATLERYIQVWAATVVNLCHAYDPDTVLLSGGVLQAGPAVCDPIRQYVAENLWPSQPRPAVVVPAQPEQSVLLGLAALAGGNSKESETLGG